MLLKHVISDCKTRVYRTRASLWFPVYDLVLPRYNNILLVRHGPQGCEIFPAHNIVTDDGDTYYAQRMSVETPTNTFNSLYLSTVAWDATHPQKSSNSDDIASMIAGSEKAVAATYPRTNDPDADNTGAGPDVTSWLFSYAKADFNDNDIEAGAITLAGVTSWGGGAGTDPLLTGFALTTFAKTANDTLKVFVNHTANGT